jgi:uncharacterized protein YfaS (alpha-2-macroglobulin family)
LADREQEGEDPSTLRAWDDSPATLSTLLIAATRNPVGHPQAGRVAGRLLGTRSGWGLAWGSAGDTGRALAAIASYASAYDWPESSAARVTLDGRQLTPTAGSSRGARFPFTLERLIGAERLRVEAPEGERVYFAMDGRYAVPLSEVDEEARGNAVALHRVYETPEGVPIEGNAEIPLGSMIRVRLFVHSEGAPSFVGVRDPIPAGFDAVDATMETTPRASLMALFGMSPDDDAVDARAARAMRTIGSLSARSYETDAASFYFAELPGGLSEITYAIRAATLGEFTAPPAQIEGLRDPSFVGRSTVARLRVVEAR